MDAPAVAPIAAGARSLLWAARAAPTAAEVLVGLEVIEALPGRVSAQMRLPDGGVRMGLGWIGMLVDAVSGRPLHLSLPSESSCRTVNLRVDTAGDQVRSGEVLTATGRLVHHTGGVAVSRSEVHGGDGRLVGLGTARFSIVAETPFAVPTTGGAVPVHRQGDGVGDLWTYLRCSVVSAEPGHEAVSMSIPAGLGNQYGGMHGGLHPVLAEMLLTRVLQLQGRPAPPELVDINVTYHRPVPVDGSSILLDGWVIKSGRRIVAAAGQILGRDGAVLASLNGTGASPG